MHRIGILCAVLIAVPALAADWKPAAKLKGWQGPKPTVACACRHKNGRAELGEKICLNRGGRMVTVECTKVLNNTAWRTVGEGCDVAALPISIRMLN